MDTTPTSPDRGFAFPGRFEIAAIGAADAGLDALLPEVLAGLGLPVDCASLRQRPSAQGKYVSVSIGFEARTRADYEAAHAALRARPEVKWTL